MNVEITKELKDILEKAVIPEKGITVLKIEAVAGSGKTTGLVEIAKQLAPYRGTYFAYNKAMQMDAQARFPANILCKTFNSVGYQMFGAEYKHKLSRPKGGGYVNVALTASEIARYFDIQSYGISITSYIRGSTIGFYIKKTVSSFECSADPEIMSHHLPADEIDRIVRRKLKDSGQDPSTYRGFAENIKKNVLSLAKRLWALRIDLSSSVCITHDTYMKLWQMSDRVGSLPIMLVDEAQDINGCFLSIMKHNIDKNPNLKLIIFVGDSRQSIYQWRGAVNALARIPAISLPLTKSYRYGQEVADVATVIIEGSSMIQGNEKKSTKVGFSNVVDTSKPYCCIFRTNTALIDKAIELTQKGETVRIEGDIADYKKRLTSAYSLFIKDFFNVKHEDILCFEAWEDLVNEAENDAELERLVKRIESGAYHDLFEAIEKIERIQTEGRSYHVLLTTAHKSKGLTYDQVILGDDFPEPREKKDEPPPSIFDLDISEKNLMYVAASRAVSALQLNAVVGRMIRESKLPHTETISKLYKEFCAFEAQNKQAF